MALRTNHFLPMLTLCLLVSAPTFAQEGPLAGQVLTFELDYAIASSLNEDGLRVAQVHAWVTGGTAGDWAATGIAIAEAAATGEYVDSVKVTVGDGNLKDLNPEPGMALLARVYFSPDAAKSAWTDLGLAAEYAKNTTSREEVELQQFYQRTLEHLLDDDTEFYEADSGAVKATNKTFRLSGELRVPGPNLTSSERGREAFAVSGSIRAELRQQLAFCLSNPANQPEWGCH